MRLTNRELDPLWGAGTRFALAAALLALLVVRLRESWPRGAALQGAVLFGLLNFAGAFGFAYYALVHLQAGLGSTLLALAPLATLVLAVLQGQEQLRVAAVVGGVTAMAGVAVLSEAALDRDVPPMAVAAGLLSVLCFAQASVLVRRFPPVHPLVMNTVGMAVGAAVLLGLSLALREDWTLPARGATWLAFAYLVLAGSIVVFLLFLYVLRHWAASRAAYFDVLIPPAAVALSAWLDDEPLTWGLLVGGLLVVGGAYVGALRPPP